MKYKMVIIMDNGSEISTDTDIENVTKIVKRFSKDKLFMITGSPCNIVCNVSKVSSFSLTPIKEATCPDNSK